MSHHSEDYKIVVVKHYLEGKDDMRDTCKLFKCKYQSLSRWVKKYNENGNVYRKTRKNHNLKITIEIERFVNNYVRKYNTTTLWELSKLVYNEFNVHLTSMSIHNILTNNNITRKRLRNKYYPEKKIGQEKEDLQTFYNTLQTKYNYNKTICLDETSIYLNMTLTYGRSKSGTRVIKKTNKYPYKRYNLLCAISDNIPYHPETNAIEEYFSQLKHYVKKESPNTYDDIYNVITDIIDKKIKKEHLTNYMKHSYKIYKS